MAVWLNRPRPRDGFYEMFSDLIFGMMAVFVLLFIVLISLLKPPSPEVVAPTNIDLVIAIDVSGSMGEQIAQLKTALGELGNNFPNLIDDFRIGLVAYRDLFVAGNEHYISFPLKPMTDRNLAGLLAFLDENVIAAGGYVDPVQAISRGLELFTPNYLSDDRTRIFVLIGDMSPEYTALSSIGDPDTTDAPSAAAKFTGASSGNRVLAIYSGIDTDGRDYGFFCEFAKAANANGRFVTGSQLLIWKLLAELWEGANNSAGANSPSATELDCQW